MRIVFFNVQLGHAEPFYGTLCVYNMERKERVSEDFHFQFLPPGIEGVSGDVISVSRMVFCMCSAALPVHIVHTITA